jgi:hypothetical protein
MVCGIYRIRYFGNAVFTCFESPLRPILLYFGSAVSMARGNAVLR